MKGTGPEEATGFEKAGGRVVENAASGVLILA
jgi:hypothetical protein